MDFAVSVDHWVKMKKRQKIYNYSDLSRERKKKDIMKVTVILIVVGAPGTIPKAQKGDWRNWKSENNRDNIDYIIIEIGWITQKSPDDLRKLAVTQTPVKIYQLKLVPRTQKPWNNDNNWNNNYYHYTRE